MEINRLSLNSDGAFLTIIHKRMPHKRNRNSTKKIKYSFKVVSVREYSKQCKIVWQKNGCDSMTFCAIISFRIARKFISID